MTATRIDDVLTALVARAAAAQATTLAGVTVQDGPWPAAYVVTDLDFLIVGGDFEPTQAGQSAVSTVPTASPMGNNSFDEALTVRGVVVSQSGDTAMGPRRARAVAVLEAFQDLLTADPTLVNPSTGVPLLSDAALLAVDGLRQVQMARGAYAAFNWTISADALIWNG